MRALKRIALLLAVLAVVGAAGFYAAFGRTGKPDAPAGRAYAESEVGGEARCGDGALRTVRGIAVMHLRGDPYDLGYQNGRLTRGRVARIERHLLGEFARVVPNPIVRALLVGMGVTKYPSLFAHVPPDLRTEFRGSADGCGNPSPLLGDYYRRIVFYHSFHDLTQEFGKSPLLACTGIAAAAPATAGHLVVGRNFDFEGGRIFDEGKILIVSHPTEGHAFASVAWGGMASVVTGVNDARLFLAILAAASRETAAEGVPVNLLLRGMLQRCASIGAVVAFAKANPIMGPNLFLVADGKTGAAGVLELTAKTVAFRAMTGGRLVVTNHFLTKPLADDPENLALAGRITTRERYDRAAELLAAQAGAFDPAAAIAVLRDTRLAGGGELPLGDRRAINALNTTHSVAADLTAGVLYVSRGPNVVGPYVGFDLARLFGPANRFDDAVIGEVPADPVTATDAYRRFLGSGDPRAYHF
jgi:hypothetical protein